MSNLQYKKFKPWGNVILAEEMKYLDDLNIIPIFSTQVQKR